MGAVDDNDARKAEVDGCCEEDWADCYADKFPVDQSYAQQLLSYSEALKWKSLHHKWLLDERIEMHLHTSNVSDYFEDETTEHSDREADGSVVDSKYELDEE